MKDIKHLIVPDVHGRKFWEKIKDYDVPCIFLGDYVDPYTATEGIKSEESIDVLNEIIEYKKLHDNITLLLGNHDMEYAINLGISRCRYDYKNAEKIHKIFEDNKDLFDIAYEFNVCDKRFFCTHAGIHKLWYEKYKHILGDSYKEAFNAEKLNKLFHERNDNFITSLMDVSMARGGWNIAGSLIWSDITEFFRDTESFIDENTIQIVGHTMLKKPILKNLSENIYCIDTQQCFYVDKNGNVDVLK